MLASISYNQTATYWAPQGQSGFGGLRFAAPTVIDVRWEDKAEAFVKMDGTEQVSRSVVYSLDTLVLGGYLLRGTSSDLDPTELDAALEIQRIDNVPDLRNLNEQHVAYL